MSQGQIILAIVVASLWIGLSAVEAPTAQAQAPVTPMPGMQGAPSSAGATGVQSTGSSGLTVLPQTGIGGQVGQGAAPLGGQQVLGTGPVRLPNQNCGGMGQCAWLGQAPATAACTVDARVCMSVGSGPMYPTMVCATSGTLRTCSDPSAGGLGILNGGASTGVATDSGYSGSGLSLAAGTMTVPSISTFSNTGTGLAPGNSYTAPGITNGGGASTQGTPFPTTGNGPVGTRP